MSDIERIQLFEGKKMRKREAGLAEYVGTNCPQVEMLTPTGKHRKTLAGEMAVILRIIESIPSKKAEPFKRWMASVAAEQAIDHIQSPERLPFGKPEDQSGDKDY